MVRVLEILGPGGWAAIIRRGSSDIIITGNERNTTNNRMELLAAISALEMVRSGETILLHSDSKYVVDGITKWVPGWKRNGWVTKGKSRVINKDLWLKLDALKETYNVQFQWQRGHSTDEIDTVDRLAKEESKGLLT